jgi:FkbM family methyltransferase
MIEWVFEKYSHSKVIHQVIHPVLEKFLPTGRTWIVSVPSGPLKGLNLEIDLRLERQFLSDRYEPSMVEMMKKLIKPGMTCYDIGAHIGFYSFLMAKLSGPHGAVLAFEPNPPIFARLQRNIILNYSKVPLEIKPFSMAIAERNGKRNFFKGGSSCTGRLVDFPKSVKDSDLFQVPCEPLDALVFEQEFPPPNIIKIDVENAENLVMEGMRRILAEVKPIITCAIHSIKNGQQIYECLKKENYHLYSVDSKKEWLLPKDIQKGLIFANP